MHQCTGTGLCGIAGRGGGFAHQQKDQLGGVSGFGGVCVSAGRVVPDAGLPGKSDIICAGGQPDETGCVVIYCSTGAGFRDALSAIPMGTVDCGGAKRR